MFCNIYIYAFDALSQTENIVVNWLVPGIWGYNPNLVVFKLTSTTQVLSLSCAIVPRNQQAFTDD